MSEWPMADVFKTMIFFHEKAPWVAGVATVAFSSPEVHRG